MSSSSPTRTGGCLCGRTRFSATGKPRFVANCHCRSCRKATGGAYGTWAGFADTQIEWSGEPRALHESSPGVTRGFCAHCGSPLSYQGARWPGETHVTIGVFDRAEDLVPKGDVYTEEALPWARPAKQSPS